jgi:hypothetical protein
MKPHKQALADQMVAQVRSALKGEPKQREPRKGTKAYRILHEQEGLNLHQIAEKVGCTMQYAHQVNEMYSDHPKAKWFEAKRGAKPRLTEQDESAIFYDDRAMVEVAKDYGIAASTVCRIKKRLSVDPKRHWSMTPAGDWELLHGSKRYRIEQLAHGYALYVKPLHDSPDAEYLGAFARLELAMGEVDKLIGDEK